MGLGHSVWGTDCLLSQQICAGDDCVGGRESDGTQPPHKGLLQPKHECGPLACVHISLDVITALMSCPRRCTGWGVCALDQYAPVVLRNTTWWKTKLQRSLVLKSGRWFPNSGAVPVAHLSGGYLSSLSTKHGCTLYNKQDCLLFLKVEMDYFKQLGENLRRTFPDKNSFYWHP